MFYGKYRGRSHGRIMCFLFKMDSNSDRWARIGDMKDDRIGRIYYGDGVDANGKSCNGPLFATYTWIGDTDVPLFKFSEKFRNDYEDRFFEAMIYIIDHEARCSIGLWSQCQHEENERQKEEDRKRKFREAVMKGICEEIESELSSCLTSPHQLIGD